MHPHVVSPNKAVHPCSEVLLTHIKMKQAWFLGHLLLISIPCCTIRQESFSKAGHAGTDGQEQPAASQQALLVALGTLGRTSSARHAKPLLACMPGILNLVLHEPRQAVRSSAMACVASLVSGLSTAALPALPKLVPVLLEAAEKAVKGLHVSVEDDHMSAASSEDSDEVLSASTSTFTSMFEHMPHWRMHK